MAAVDDSLDPGLPRYFAALTPDSPWKIAGYCLAALALAAPMLAIPALDSDSYQVVYAQGALRHPGAFWHLFRPDYFVMFGEGGYRPLTTLCYGLIVQCFGGAPIVFRFARFALHFGCSALVYSMAMLLLESPVWALVSAAAYFICLLDAFVAGVEYFPDLLATLFALASLRLTILAGARPKLDWRLCVLAAALYELSVLAKEALILLPFISLVSRRLLTDVPVGSRRGLCEQMPLWLVMAAHLAFMRWVVLADSYYGKLSLGWHLPWTKMLSLATTCCTSFFGDSLAAALVAVALLSGFYGSDRRTFAKKALMLVVWVVLGLLPVIGGLPFPKRMAQLMGFAAFRMSFPGAALACILGLVCCRLVRIQRWRVAAVILPALCVLRPVIFDANIVLDYSDLMVNAVRLPSSSLVDAGTPPFFKTALLSMPLIRTWRPELYRRMADGLVRTFPEGMGRAVVERYGDPRLLKDPVRAKLAFDVSGASHVGSFLDEFRRQEAASSLEARLGRLQATAESHPQDEESCIALVEALERSGDIYEAAQRRAVCPVSDPSAVAQYFLAENDWKEGRWREAMIAAESAGAKLRFRKRIHADTIRADALSRLGRYRDASVVYTRIVEECPRQDDLSSPDPCEMASSEAENLRSGAREAYERGIQAFEAGRVSEARAAFTTAIESSPNFAEAYLSRGATWSAMNAWKRALEDYDAGLRVKAVAPLVREALVSSRATALSRLTR